MFKRKKTILLYLSFIHLERIVPHVIILLKDNNNNHIILVLVLQVNYRQNTKSWL